MAKKKSGDDDARAAPAVPSRRAFLRSTAAAGLGPSADLDKERVFEHYLRVDEPTP